MIQSRAPRAAWFQDARVLEWEPINPTMRLTADPNAPHGFQLWHWCPTRDSWQSDELRICEVVGTWWAPTVHQPVIQRCCGLRGWLHEGDWSPA